MCESDYLKYLADKDRKYLTNKGNMSADDKEARYTEARKAMISDPNADCGAQPCKDQNQQTEEIKEYRYHLKNKYDSIRKGLYEQLQECKARNEALEAKVQKKNMVLHVINEKFSWHNPEDLSKIKDLEVKLEKVKKDLITIRPKFKRLYEQHRCRKNAVSAARLIYFTSHSETSMGFWNDRMGSDPYSTSTPPVKCEVEGCKKPPMQHCDLCEAHQFKVDLDREKSEENRNQDI